MTQLIGAFPPGFERSLTHVLPVARASETRIEDGVALYYNPSETLGPDHATLAHGRIAGQLAHQHPGGGRVSMHDAGVGTGAFLMSAALNAGDRELRLTGNDASEAALLTAGYNLAELSRRRFTNFTHELRLANWDDILLAANPAALDPDAPYDFIHWNPPYLSDDGYLGVGEGTTAPRTATIAPLNEQGIPEVYEKYLLGIYRLLGERGLAFIRLPEEAISGMPGYSGHIAALQRRAFEELGLCYTELHVDVPEKNPTPWENPLKRVPYRTAYAMIVARELPEFFAARLQGSGHYYEDERRFHRIIYQDIQCRVVALSGPDELALVKSYMPARSDEPWRPITPRER